jgi:hypothetical protein
MVFFAGLLGLLAPALIVLGSFVIWLSPTPKPVEKWIAVASAILFPLVLSQIAPSLPGMRFVKIFGPGCRHECWPRRDVQRWTALRSWAGGRAVAAGDGAGSA